MDTNLDFPDLPDFLDRKKNGIKSEAPTHVRASAQKLVWPKKKNWRRIEKLRREREKREGANLHAGAILQRKGQ